MTSGFSTSRRALLTGTGAMAATSLFSRPAAALQAAGQSRQKAIMRPIPKTGEMIPAVGLGTFETFDVTPGEPRDNIREVIRIFHERGGRVIDTSPLYGMAEVCVGDFITDLGISDDIFVTNKTWTTGDYLSDNSHSERQLRQSRERLWRPQIDVLQVHSLENHDQVRHWLAQKKSEGSIRYVGITQWSPEYYDTMERLVNTGTLDFVQIAYTILSRSAEQRLLDACAANGVAVQVNVPFEKRDCLHPLPVSRFRNSRAKLVSRRGRNIFSSGSFHIRQSQTSFQRPASRNMSPTIWVRFTVIFPIRRCARAWSSIIWG